MVIRLYIGGKQAEQIGDSSPQDDGTFRRTAMHDHEVVLMGQLLNEVEILRFGAMPSRQLFAREVGSLGQGLAALLLHAFFEGGHIAG